MYVTWPCSTVTLPCVSAPAWASVTTNVCKASFDGPAVSFTTNDAALIPNGLPPGSRTLSAPAFGGSFTSVTVIDTVAGTDVACPSNTVKVNASFPK